MPDATASLPLATVEHRIPGRMRLRVRAMRGDATFFERARTGLAGLPGVQDVRANPATGGILVRHDGDDGAIIARAREERLFETGPLPPLQATAREPAPAPAATVSPLDLAALGLAGAGLLQIARGQVVGSATENLWNAFGLYAVNRQPWLASVLVGFGLLQVARGAVLGSATSLFLYALSARRMARHQAVGGAI